MGSVVPSRQDTFTSAAAGQVALNYNSGANGQSLLVDGRIGNLRRVWIDFDLAAAVPLGTTWGDISKATLTVYINAITSAGTLRIEAAKSPWSELSLTHSNAPSTVSDPKGAAYATATATMPGKYVTFEVTELVKDWFDGTLPNNGLVIVAGDTQVRLAMDSKESTLTSHSAFLEITLASVVSPQGWLSGAGTPSSSLGIPGDFYFDTIGGVVFGPKETDGWGIGTSLRGATGPVGAVGPSGASWISGKVAPSSIIGRLGDFYFNSHNNRFYGPKLSSGWGTGVSVVGPAGPAGMVGPPGIAGPSGAAGKNGAPGLVGPDGPAGPTGVSGKGWIGGLGTPSSDLGTLGDWYFDGLMKQYYGPKDAAGWGNAFSLMGPQGVEGERGAPGLNGSQGLPGLQGKAGVMGFVGPRGESGAAGPVGPIGEPGPAGVVGPQGLNGRNWISGSGTPESGIGDLGDLFFNIENKSVFGPKNSDGWGAAVSFKGDRGDDGLSGAKWLVGTGIPERLRGEDGDLYLDVGSGQVWGPKQSGGWGDAILSLRGGDGIQGPQGGVGVPSHIEPQGDLSMGIFTVQPNR